MEIIYNLQPLEFYLEEQAFKAYHLVSKTVKANWLNPGGQPRHVKHLGKKAELLNSPNNFV